jgi:hypothetical protein
VRWPIVPLTEDSIRLLIAERLKAIHLIRQRCPATGDTHQGSLDLSGRLLARLIEPFGRLVPALGCINHVFYQSCFCSAVCPPGSPARAPFCVLHFLGRARYGLGSTRRV